MHRASCLTQQRYLLVQQMPQISFRVGKQKKKAKRSRKMQLSCTTLRIYEYALSENFVYQVFDLVKM